MPEKSDYDYCEYLVDPYLDWHERRAYYEPDCRRDEWRQRDRSVIKMRDMANGHLENAIRFAVERDQHQSKLTALLAEKARREGISDG